MFSKANLGYLSQIAIKSMQLLVLIASCGRALKDVVMFLTCIDLLIKDNTVMVFDNYLPTSHKIYAVVRGN